jgi:hypothetical protein
LKRFLDSFHRAAPSLYRPNGSSGSSTLWRSLSRLPPAEKQRTRRVHFSSLQQIPEQRALLPQPLWWLVGGLVVAWGGVVFGSFQYDDFANVLNDPATTDLYALFDRLFGGIRPLTRLSYAVSAALFGEWAGGWLLVQWLVHLATVLMILRLTELRTQDRRAAWIAAACFAFLPSSGAAIAYVSGRSIGFSTAWLIAALLAHEASRHSARRSLMRSLAMLSFFAACATRETALIFPALALLWERTRSSQSSWSECIKQTRTYFICAAFMTAAALAAIPRYEELLQFSFSYRSPLESILTNLAALPATLSLSVRPWALSVEHSAAFEIRTLAIGACSILLMVAIAVRIRLRHPSITLALLWPLIALLPTHSFIAKLDSVTEGPLYLACIGPAIATGIYVSRWLMQRSINVAMPVLMSAAAAAVVLCAWRTLMWIQPAALWEEATLRAPHSVRSWTNLGMAELNAGNYAAARLAFHKAIDLEPSNPRAMLNLEVIAAINPQEPGQHP